MAAEVWMFTVERNGELATFSPTVRELLDVSECLFVALDRHARVVLINQKACALLGYEEAELIGLDWIETAIPERDRDTIRSVFQRIMSGGLAGLARYQNSLLAKDGTESVVAWHNSVLTDVFGDRIGTLSSGVDVSATSGDDSARLSERELGQLRYALDQAAIVARTDVAGRIHYVNDKFCEISGFSREELLGQDHRIVNSHYHPRAFMKDLWRTIGRGNVWRGEICNRRKDGGEYWVDTTIVPLLDERGKPYEYIAIRTDITDRKRAELQLREQESLTKLGEMASVVAHEVRNPLAGMQGALQVIARRMDQESTERAIIGDILDRIRALNDTLEDLLSFVRARTPTLGRVEIQAVAVSTISQMQGDPRADGVNISVDGEDLVCSADVSMFSAALLNLLLNAAEATGSGGHVTVHCTVENGVGKVVVQDDGPGIARDVVEKVFEPFFTTKARGTGLGLPTVRRWIQIQGGDVRIECPPRGGTRVILTLPLAES